MKVVRDKEALGYGSVGKVVASGGKAAPEGSGSNPGETCWNFFSAYFDGIRTRDCLKIDLPLIIDGFRKKCFCHAINGWPGPLDSEHLLVLEEVGKGGSWMASMFVHLRHSSLTIQSAVLAGGVFLTWISSITGRSVEYTPQGWFGRMQE